jgi:hypothetical protein
MYAYVYTYIHIDTYIHTYTHVTLYKHVCTYNTVYVCFIRAHYIYMYSEKNTYEHGM